MVATRLLEGLAQQQALILLLVATVGAFATGRSLNPVANKSDAGPWQGQGHQRLRVCLSQVKPRESGYQPAILLSATAASAGRSTGRMLVQECRAVPFAAQPPLPAYDVHELETGSRKFILLRSCGH